MSVSNAMELEVSSEVPTHCENCGSPLEQKDFFWLFGCGNCHLLVSTLGAYTDSEAVSGYESGEHSSAFEVLRRENAEITLGMMSDLGSVPGLDLLEVGSAQGFFLQVAATQGYRCTGIEPNRQLRECKSNRGLSVIGGFFPDALTTQDAFDIIVFNDVIEHIPDIRNTLAYCNSYLNPDGILVVNVPMRDGVFYTIGRLGKVLGWKVPLERLWQVGTMSPHLYYFDRRSLTELANKSGFELISTKRLKTVTIKGLWKRLRVTSNFGFLTASFIWIATVVLVPFLRFLPADSRVFAYRKGASK